MTKDLNQKGNCGESCGCDPQDLKKDVQKNLEEKTVEKEVKKLDPTHFGDWQINGRAIDF